MPRMTAELLAKCTGHAKRKRNESPDQFLRRITHLYCSEKGIAKIEGLTGCQNLSVLYLYNNCLAHIENLSPCPLTHVYLQNNHLSCIENLSKLYRLTKLYLSGNAITVVEGLEGLSNLTELHVANQRLPEGEKLHFEPRSFRSLSSSLEVLNVSGNGLDTLDDLVYLKELVYLSACDNKLTSMRVLSQALHQLPMLTKLELSGNPLCHKHKYRDRVITMGRKIYMLDGREVGETEKQFLINWKAIRKSHRKHYKEAVQTETTESVMDIIPTAKHISSRPALPMTMPALPARQLPRGKKRHETLVHEQSLFHEPYPAHADSNMITVQQESYPELRGIHLPDIVTKYHADHTLTTPIHNPSMLHKTSHITGDSDHIEGTSNYFVH